MTDEQKIQVISDIIAAGWDVEIKLTMILRTIGVERETRTSPSRAGTYAEAIRGVLADGREHTVHDLSSATGLAGPVVSTTLQGLRKLGQVTSEAFGVWRAVA